MPDEVSGSLRVSTHPKSLARRFPTLGDFIIKIAVEAFTGEPRTRGVLKCHDSVFTDHRLGGAGEVVAGVFAEVIVGKVIGTTVGVRAGYIDRRRGDVDAYEAGNLILGRCSRGSEGTALEVYEHIIAKLKGLVEEL